MEEVREYIKSKLGVWGIEPTKLELEFLIGSNSLPDGYTADQKVMLAKTLLVKIIPELLLQPDVTEGGYSIKRNKDGIISYYGILCADLGLPNGLASTKPTLTDRSNAW